MTNEIIGIAGIFGLTLFLFLLRYLYLSIGRTNKSRYIPPTTVIGNPNPNKKVTADDSWLLWTGDRDAKGGA